MRKDSKMYRFIVLVVCLCMILPTFNVPLVFAEKTAGTEDHVADANTIDSYRNLIALRDDSRRAGRVWADKSVFTDEVQLQMDWDGYDGKVSTDEDFLHVFSALGSSQVANSKETIPLDVVFILDFSTSMANASQLNSRLQQTVNAVNDAINSIINLSPDSRVGIATYGQVGNQLLPLVKLIPEAGKKDTQWLEITSYSQSFTGVVKIAQSAKKAVSSSEWTDISINNTSSLTGATNLQAGLAAGMGMLAEESVTTWKSPMSNIEYGRIPVVMVMTDGGSNTLCKSNNQTIANDAAAWYATKFDERRNTYADDSIRLGSPTDTIAPVIVPTLMTAAYNTARVDANYAAHTQSHEKRNGKGQGVAYVYGIGVDIASLNDYMSPLAVPKINATLNPRVYFNSNPSNDQYGEIKKAFGYYETWRTGNSTVHVGRLRDTKYTGMTDYPDVQMYVSQLPAGKSPTKQDVADNLYFTDEYRDVTAGELSKLFIDLIKEVAGEKSEVFSPVGGSNDVGVEDALTYMDPIGQYMEVKNVKNVLLFGKLYDVIKDGNEQYFNEDGTPNTDGNYTYSIQNYRIDSTETITNPCYGDDGEVTFNLSDINIYIKNTGNYRDPNVEDGGIQSDTGSDQTLYIDIPSEALPMQVAKILLNEDGSVRSYVTNVGDKTKDTDDEYRAKKAQSTPIRVFYDVGIADDIKTANGNVDLTKVDPDYVNKNKNAAGDKVYFYSNWYNEKTYGYVTGGKEYTFGDPVLTFSPSKDNRYYIFQSAHPLYNNPDKDTIGGVLSGSNEDGWVLNGKSLGDPITDTVDPDKWYYILIEYYSPEGTIHYALPRLGKEFGSGIGGAEGEVPDDAYLCWYNPKTDKYEDYVKADGTTAQRPGSDYVIAAKPDGLRVGDMAAGIGEKSNGNNKTGTASTYYMPTVSSSTEGNSSDDVIINLYLGNNGRLAVSDTQLLVTKTVDTIGANSDVLKDMSFLYTIKLEGQNGHVNAIKATREESGTWRALIETIELLSNNKGLLLNNDGSLATVDIDQGGNIDTQGTSYYIYVGGVGAGENFTRTLFDSKKGDSFHGILGTGQEIYVEDVYLIPVSIYNNDWSFSDDGSLRKIKSFPVGRVGFDGNTQIGFAVQTDYQSKTTYQTEALHFENDIANFELKDGEGLLFIGMDSGTKYTVTEKLTDEQVDEGVLLKGVTHKENSSSNTEKVTRYYGNKGNQQDSSHNFNEDTHTYAISGDTTAILTEEVNYFNYLPRAEKTEIEHSDDDYVKVGDQLTYVIYWENYAMNENGEYVAEEVTVTDRLDPGVDFVDADFVVANALETDTPGETQTVYEKMNPVPDDWSVTYSKEDHTVIWNIKADAKQYGYVQIHVKVNKEACKYWNVYEETTPTPDPDSNDYLVLNRARVHVKNYPEIHTDIVKKPIDGFHKTETKVDNIDVGETKGNLKENQTSGNFVGPKVDEGSNITYKISFVNYKYTKATIIVTDKLDPGVDYVSASCDDVTQDTEDESTGQNDIKITYDADTHTVTWEIPNVASLTAGEVTLVVKVNENANKGWHYTNADGIEGEDVESMDYKVLNRASVKVDNDKAQITETMENPLFIPMEFPDAGSRGQELLSLFGSLIFAGAVLWFVNKNKKNKLANL